MLMLHKIYQDELIVLTKDNDLGIDYHNSWADMGWSI